MKIIAFRLPGSFAIISVSAQAAHDVLDPESASCGPRARSPKAPSASGSAKPGIRAVEPPPNLSMAFEQQPRVAREFLPASRAVRVS